MKISIKKLTEDAQLPMRAHDSDAGYDLYSSEAVTLQPLERRAVKTGISFALPELLPDREVYGRVAPRSGLAVNKGLDVEFTVPSENIHPSPELAAIATAGS